MIAQCEAFVNMVSEKCTVSILFAGGDLPAQAFQTLQRFSTNDGTDRDYSTPHASYFGMIDKNWNSGRIVHDQNKLGI